MPTSIKISFIRRPQPLTGFIELFYHELCEKAFRSFPAGAVFRDIEEDAGRKQRNEHCASALADEGQGDAGQGREAEHAGYVYERLDGQVRNDADREEASE